MWEFFFFYYYYIHLSQFPPPNGSFDVQIKGDDVSITLIVLVVFFFSQLLLQLLLHVIVKNTCITPINSQVKIQHFIDPSIHPNFLCLPKKKTLLLSFSFFVHEYTQSMLSVFFNHYVSNLLICCQWFACLCESNVTICGMMVLFLIVSH